MEPLQLRLVSAGIVYNDSWTRWTGEDIAVCTHPPCVIGGFLSRICTCFLFSLRGLVKGVADLPTRQVGQMAAGPRLGAIGVGRLEGGSPIGASTWRVLHEASS